MDACDICECHECAGQPGEGPGLLVSPWLRWGGIACIALWSAFIYVVTR